MNNDAPDGQLVVMPPKVEPLMLLDKAISAGMDPEKLGRLMDLVDRWRETQAKEHYCAAMARCQLELPVVVAGDRLRVAASGG